MVSNKLYSDDFFLLQFETRLQHIFPLFISETQTGSEPLNTSSTFNSIFAGFVG